MPHINLNNAGIEYKWWGTAGEGMPSIVLVHGAMRSASTWEWLGESLARATGTRVLAFSRWGHGKSDDPIARPNQATLVLDEAHEVLPGFRRALRLSDVIIVGEGDGAAMALVHASTEMAPRAVVALAPWIRLEASIRRWVNSATPLDIANHHDSVHTQQLVRDHWNSEDLDGWHIDHFVRDVRCPVMVLQSANDVAISATQSHGISELIPSSDVTWLTGTATCHPSNAPVIGQLVKELLVSMGKTSKTGTDLPRIEAPVPRR